MRVNIEDDLEASGRLAKFAQLMKWDTDRALGRLVRFYRATQDAELVTASRETIVSVTLVRSKTKNEALLVIEALVGSQLADIEDDGQITIRGNDTHISRLQQIRANASTGGKRKASNRLANAKRLLESGCPPAPYSYNTDPQERKGGNTGSVTQLPCYDPLSEEARLAGAGAHDRALRLKRIWLEAHPGITAMKPEEWEKLREVPNQLSDAEGALKRYLADESDYYRDKNHPVWLFVKDLEKHATAKVEEESIYQFLNKHRGAK